MPASTPPRRSSDRAERDRDADLARQRVGLVAREAAQPRRPPASPRCATRPATAPRPARGPSQAPSAGPASQRERVPPARSADEQQRRSPATRPGTTGQPRRALLQREAERRRDPAGQQVHPDAPPRAAAAGSRTPRRGSRAPAPPATPRAARPRPPPARSSAAPPRRAPTRTRAAARPGPGSGRGGLRASVATPPHEEVDGAEDDQRGDRVVDVVQAVLPVLPLSTRPACR